MGLLDEAIREHLDLKRRSGADPSEVDRLEREALGPVRRSPEDSADLMLDQPSPSGAPYHEEEDLPYPSAEEAPEWDDAYADPAPFDHAAEPAAGAPQAEDWSEPPTQIGRVPSEEEFAPPPDRSGEAARHHEIAEEWEAHERGLAGEPAGYEPDVPAPAPPPPAPEPYSPPPAGVPGESVFGAEPESPPRPDFDQETAEYHVEEAEPEPPEASEGSEGEDVLEETPDFLQDTPDHDRLWFEQRPPRDFDFDG
jgi:hypothetical protein